MTISILRTTLFCVVLILSLFSDKLFKQHVKIVKIICTIFLLVISLSYLF